MGVEYCTIQVAYIEAPTRRWCESIVLVFSHHHVSHNDEGSKLCIMIFRLLRGSIFGFVYCLLFSRIIQDACLCSSVIVKWLSWNIVPTSVILDSQLYLLQLFYTNPSFNVTILPYIPVVRSPTITTRQVSIQRFPSEWFSAGMRATIELKRL
jgi:hypothetical protein